MGVGRHPSLCFCLPSVCQGGAFSCSPVDCQGELWLSLPCWPSKAKPGEEMEAIPPAQAKLPRSGSPFHSAPSGPFLTQHPLSTE